MGKRIWKTPRQAVPRDSEGVRAPTVRSPARSFDWLRRLLPDHGAALVETAMAMTVLIPLLVGAMELSLLFSGYQDVADAARQASRWAAVRGSTSCTNLGVSSGSPNYCDATTGQIQSFVRGLYYAGVVSSNLQVTTSYLTATAPPTSWSSCTGSGCNLPGNEVKVVVSYAFPISFPLWRATTVNISSTGTMVIAQ